MPHLIYPTADVSLADLAAAAVQECGADHVSIYSGSGSRAVQLPETCAERVRARFGLATDSASEPDVDSSPGSDAPTTRPSGRPSGRASGRTGKTTARRTSTRRKEG